jgi:hypothetical protein
MKKTMSDKIAAATPPLKLTITGGYIVSVLFIGAGVWLVSMGATGQTEISSSVSPSNQ